MDRLGLASYANADTATPHRMGAALTYAYRYALFPLVGIAARTMSILLTSSRCRNSHQGLGSGKEWLTQWRSVPYFSERGWPLGCGGPLLLGSARARS